jgi:8-oxo-dGTP pyrophosphatase MutT (NUDIX family)
MPRTLRDAMFQTFWRLQRPLTIGVRGVVVREDGHVLLVRHTYTPGWHFPGGGVEQGEPTQLAVRREMQEEAGIIAEGPLDLLSVHFNHAFFPNDHVLVYRARAWRQVELTSRMEIAEVRFCDPLNPPAETTQGTLNRLAEIFRGAEKSDLW